MKKIHLLFIFIITLNLVGCNQLGLLKKNSLPKKDNSPKVVKKEIVNVIDLNNTLNKKDTIDAYKSAFIVLRNQNKMDLNGTEITFYFNKGTAVIEYQNKFTKEKKQKANELIKELKKEINTELNELNYLRKNISKIIYIDNDALTPKQKEIFLKAFLKKYGYLIKIHIRPYFYSGDTKPYYSVCWPKRKLQYDSLLFVVDDLKCGYYVQPYKTILKKKVMLDLDIYFTPEYNFNIDNVFNVKVKSIQSEISYRKGLIYETVFKNISGDYQKITRVSFYCLDRVNTFNKFQKPNSMMEYDDFISLAPFTTSNTYWFKAIINSLITRNNKNNLRYGIAVESNGRTYSRINTTNLDELFKKVK